MTPADTADTASESDPPTLGVGPTLGRSFRRDVSEAARLAAAMFALAFRLIGGRARGTRF
jgi:hypothetical protein